MSESMPEEEVVVYDNEVISVDSGEVTAIAETSSVLPTKIDHIARRIEQQPGAVDRTNDFDEDDSRNDLAKTIYRRQRPITSWFWSGVDLSNVTTSSSVDCSFERRILQGLTQIAPKPPSWKFEGGREFGCVSSTSSSPRALPLSEADVKHRREHAFAHSKRPPDLLRGWRTLQTGTLATSFLNVFHNAIRLELLGMHKILSSLLTRKYDLTNADMDSWSTWLGTFGDLVRLYIASSERFLFSALEPQFGSELHEDMLTEKRKADRMRLICCLEEIEGLKRPIQARVDSRSRLLSELSRLSDEATVLMVNHLEAEIEQVPTFLSRHWGAGAVVDTFTQMARWLQESSAAGPIMLVILARGAHRSAQGQAAWLCEFQQRQGIRSIASGGRAGAARRWMKRYGSCHQDHVVGFSEAEEEYRELYA